MLKINLLPRSEIVGPINKKLLVVVVVALGAWIAFWMFTAAGVQKKIQEVDKKIEEVRPIAQQVDSLTSELNSKQAELAPIAAKVKFVEEADKSGEPWWDRFHKIKRYIPSFARVTSFVLTNNSVEFNVTVKGTTQFARFVINLLRCPHITSVTLGGLGPGRGLPSGEPPEPGEWPTGRGQPLTASMAALAGGGGGAVQTAPTGMPGGGAPGMPGPMGPPGMGAGGPPGMGAPGGAMGPPPMGPPGAAGGPPGMGGEMGPMGPPGGMPGMPGMGGPTGARAGGGVTDPESEEISFTVRAQLVEPIQTPQPPGAGGAAAGAGAGMPGMGGAGMPGMGGAGMPGMGGGMPGMGGAGGMPGMGGPPGAGGPAGGGAMGPPSFSPGGGGEAGGAEAGGGEG